MIAATDCFWLTPAMEALRSARAAGRVGHALLIHADPGCGGELHATWAAQLLLCQQDAAPCGACTDCRHAASHQHPDLHLAQPTGDSKQIRIDDVRAFCADLALTSWQRYRVGIVSPADVLNLAAANALLKTLEEPPPRTVIVLVSATPTRLPATLRSRCMRMRVVAPDLGATQAWLAAHGKAGDVAAAADVLGNAPLHCSTRTSRRSRACAPYRTARKTSGGAGLTRPRSRNAGRARNSRCGSPASGVDRRAVRLSA